MKRCFPIICAALLLTGCGTASLPEWNPPSGVKRAEQEQRKVEKRIESVENYYRC